MCTTSRPLHPWRRSPDNPQCGTTQYPGHRRCLCRRGGLPSGCSCRSRYDQRWQRNPFHSTRCQRRRANTLELQLRITTPLCPIAHRQAGKHRGVTVWPPCRRNHGPADVLCRSCWCLGQRPDLCQAIDRPLGSSRSHRESARKSRRMIILLNCRACRSKTRLSCKPHARLEARPNKLASRTAFFASTPTCPRCVQVERKMDYMTARNSALMTVARATRWLWGPFHSKHTTWKDFRLFTSLV